MNLTDPYPYNKQTTNVISQFVNLTISIEENSIKKNFSELSPIKKKSDSETEFTNSDFDEVDEEVEELFSKNMPSTTKTLFGCDRAPVSRSWDKIEFDGSDTEDIKFTTTPGKNAIRPIPRYALTYQFPNQNQ